MMKYIWHQIKKRILIHWFPLVQAVLCGVLTYLLIKDQIDVTQWGVGFGIVATLDKMFSKDTNKLPTKTKHQVPDPGTEDDYEHN